MRSRWRQETDCWEVLATSDSLSSAAAFDRQRAQTGPGNGHQWQQVHPSVSIRSVEGAVKSTSSRLMRRAVLRLPVCLWSESEREKEPSPFEAKWPDTQVAINLHSSFGYCWLARGVRFGHHLQMLSWAGVCLCSFGDQWAAESAAVDRDVSEISSRLPVIMSTSIKSNIDTEFWWSNDFKYASIKF